MTTTSPKAVLEAEYKVYDGHGGYVHVQPNADCPGLTDVTYVDAGDRPEDSKRYMCLEPETLKQVIRALERRLSEAIAEEQEP